MGSDSKGPIKSLKASDSPHSVLFFFFFLFALVNGCVRVSTRGLFGLDLRPDEKTFLSLFTPSAFGPKWSAHKCHSSRAFLDVMLRRDSSERWTELSCTSHKVPFSDTGDEAFFCCCLVFYIERHAALQNAPLMCNYYELLLSIFFCCCCRRRRYQKRLKDGLLTEFMPGMWGRQHFCPKPVTS